MFRIILRTAATAAMLLAVIPLAKGEVYHTGTYGHWTTFEGTGDRGGYVCGAAIFGSDRGLLLKAQEGTVYLQIFKDGWRIPVDQDVDVNVQVDRAPPMSFVGLGIEFPTGNNAIHVEIPPGAVWEASGRNLEMEFRKLMAQGREMHISFPHGTEPPWSASLTGSARALATFGRCEERLAKRSTQPFGAKSPIGPAPAQPFGTTPPRLTPEERSALDRSDVKAPARLK